MDFDYAIHSDFLIHWTGKDIDGRHDPDWHCLDKSKTCLPATTDYAKRLQDILTYGLWMTEEDGRLNEKHTALETPKCCFTELKLSESRKHAKRYGRLGIGVKRMFLFDRFGRPVVYFGPRKTTDDKFLSACAKGLNNKRLLNFFKPMSSSDVLNYDLYAESEWRILYFKELLKCGKIIDPRVRKNRDHYQYFKSLTAEEQKKLKYLLPLDGWFAMIIYPSLMVKNTVQQDPERSVHKAIERIKSQNDHGNRVENRNWPIEMDLDACRNF